MSTFEGRLSELENVLIDNFSCRKNETCFFLTHCHADHMKGLDSLLLELNKYQNKYLYCSPLSRLILFNKYKGSFKDQVKELTCSTVIQVPESCKYPSYQISVTPIPAGHCPGSFMFLFEIDHKTILYTGDFRVQKNDVKCIKALRTNNKVKQIDKIYFDCTFLSQKYWNFPPRIKAVEKIILIISNWIIKGVNYNVMLETSANYGYEYVFTEVAKKLQCKIHVKKSVYKLYWNVPEVGSLMTTDCKTTKIHAFYARDSKCKPCNSRQHLLVIKLSALWYKSSFENTKPICKDISRRKVLICYSNHCSCSELIEFLNFLRPKELDACTSVIGCTEVEKKGFIQELMKHWKSNEIQNKIENINATVNLERNYKFQIKFPEPGSGVAESTTETPDTSAKETEDSFFV